MPLITWEESRPWAKAIRDEVLNRRMPPWGAVRGYGEFKDDRSLTQDEIMRIAEWVEGGAPEGEPKYLPAVPEPEAATRSAPGRPLRSTLLPRAFTLVAIRPLEDTSHAKIFARRPDGSVEPLIWLMNYKQKWNRTFEFAAPLNLPRGTRIVAEPQTRFELRVR